MCIIHVRRHLRTALGHGIKPMTNDILYGKHRPRISSIRNRRQGRRFLSLFLLRPYTDHGGSCWTTPVLELSQQIIALYWRKFTPMTLIENFLRSKIVGREGGIYSQSEIKQPKYNRNKNSPTEDQRHCFLLQYCFSFIMPPPP